MTPRCAGHRGVSHTKISTKIEPTQAIRNPDRFDTKKIGIKSRDTLPKALIIFSLSNTPVQIGKSLVRIQRLTILEQTLKIRQIQYRIVIVREERTRWRLEQRKLGNTMVTVIVLHMLLKEQISRDFRPLYYLGKNST